MQKSISSELSHKLANMSFVCACLVVMIHVPFFEEEGTLSWWFIHFVRDGICRIAVPFFFVVAGYFLAGHMGEQGWWRDALRKRVRTLLLPYVIWTLVAFVYLVPLIAVANVYSGAALSRNLPSSLGGWFSAFGVTPFDFPWLAPLWFVRTLLAFIVISPIILALGGLRCRLIGVVLPLILWTLFLVYVVQMTGVWGFFWKWSLSVEGGAFFTLGIWLRCWRRPIRIPTCIGIILWITGGSLILGGIFWGHGGAWWGERLRIVGYSLLLWGVWEAVPSSPWPRNLTGNTFPLFLMHAFPIWVWTMIMNNVACLSNAMTKFLGYIVSGSCIIVLTILCAIFLKRNMPKASARIFGGR